MTNIYITLRAWADETVWVILPDSRIIKLDHEGAADQLVYVGDVETYYHRPIDLGRVLYQLAREGVMNSNDILDTVIVYIEARLKKLEPPSDTHVLNEVGVWSSTRTAATELREVLEMLKKLRES